jgi:hypothetical protein
VGPYVNGVDSDQELTTKSFAAPPPPLPPIRKDSDTMGYAGRHLIALAFTMFAYALVIALAYRMCEEKIEEGELLLTKPI